MRFQAGQPEIPLVPARGGTLVEPEVTISTLLDAAMGSTPGFFLQRGTNGWFAGVGGSGSGTVTQVSTSGLLTGTVTTTGTISLANGTANTLIGYGSGGAPTGITVVGAGSLSGGVLTITAATPGGSTGQFQINSSGSLAGITFGGDFTVNTSGIATVTKTSGVPFAPSATVDTTNAANLLSGVVALARLPVMVASGTGGLAGIAPTPGLTPGTTRFLREDATWVAPPTGTGTINTGAVNNLAAYTGTGTTVGPLTLASLATSLNVSGTNTGDQTITLTGPITGTGTGSFATTIASSVALPGSPTTTTQAVTDSSTKLATTAFVATATTISASNIITGTLASKSAPWLINLTHLPRRKKRSSFHQGHRGQSHLIWLWVTRSPQRQ